MRSGRVQNKRILKEDPIYHSKLVSRFINRVMKEGKKTVAENLVYSALTQIEAKTGKNPLNVLETAITNVSPRMEVRPRRVGGASYQVPVEVRGDRRVSLAIRWIIEACKKKPNKEFKTFSQKLEDELINASQNSGGAIKKRDDIIRMAEANRAFAHFRW